MPENFPGIEQDCQDVIRRCNALILAARACKAQVAMGSREGIRTQVQAMDKQAEEIKNEVPGAKVERVGEGIVVEFNNKILFGFDKSDLSDNAKSSLNDLVTILNKYPDTDIEVQGHTDNSGTDSYNQNLSEKRASSVAAYLRARNIASSRITTKGFGETAPKYSNDNEDGRSNNRRVEFLITANEKMKQEAKKEANQ